ncbi:ABC transporter substrate-binding protein [Aquamicrobium sp. LC103]|uniref:ABC transporter substrate-binding protein n=1 Tax=Aquamicrobium sp. LC103 TaxID=1120658 RepID=UPI000B241DD6|nr:ABC transporter substrate-binding protein [Aquamicrobium sp. LC103]TKT75726.1 ABC transporter substrate-binding protein [Aquamicrobium sp. LC103]
MKKLLLATTMLVAATMASHAQDNVVKIGVLNDQSTSFSALGGTEVVRAAELAVKDFGGSVLGNPIEILSADHQNKPDVGLALARQWLERDGVDAIADVANSAVSLGVNTLIGDQKKVGLFVSPLTDRPTEADCNGHIVAWAYDAYSTVGTTVQALLAEGGKSFYILSPDYEAGKVQESWVETAVNNAGGEIKGKVRAPLGTTDFSSYLLQAQASGAQAIVMNLNGPELVNAMKQAQEFGIIAAGQSIAVTFLHQSDARAIGVEALKGVRASTPWFWKKDATSEEFGRRMMEITGNAPGWIAAGTYSAVTAYLKAVEKAGTDESTAVLKAMREIELDDFFVSNGTLYPNGRLAHDMYLLEVNGPDDVKEKDDFFKLAATVPADKAFRPYSDSACKL